MSDLSNVSEFRDAIAVALDEDDIERLRQLVDTFPVERTLEANKADNELLQLMGAYGCSGRTERYCSLIQQLIDQGVEPDIETCAYLGLSSYAERLLELDGNVISGAPSNSRYPLHAAAERGNLHMVQWLCEHGADPAVTDPRGELAIMHAMHAGPWKSHAAEDVVEFLAEPSGVTKEAWFVAARGDVQTLRAVVGQDPEQIETHCPAGKTPLFHACHNNHRQAVAYLLEQGASATAPNKDGQTPLDTSCLHRLSGECDLEIIEMLLHSGAELTIQAAVVMEDTDAIHAFAEQSPNMLAADSELSALQYAIHTGSSKSLEVLIELGASPSDQMWKHIERIFGSDEPFVARLRRIVARNP